MKKYLKYLLLLVCILPLTGCLKKDPIDVEKFSKELEGRGFSIETITDTTNAPAGLRTAYVASKSGVNYKVELYVFDNKENATTTFENQKDDLSNKNSEKKAYAEVNGLNYSTYALDNDSGYYHMVRVDEKIIYAYGSADDKSDMKDIIKALGY